MRIASVNFQNFNYQKKLKDEKEQNNLSKGIPYISTKMFRYNYPVSFGWCEKHNVRSKEISIIFLNQLQKQQEQDAKANYQKTRVEYLDIASNSQKESLNFLMQFTNRQKNEAEFIPLWSLMNNEELRNEMQKSKIFSDPVASLISLHLVQDVKVKNNSITKEQLNRAHGSLQLHTAVILINQIEKNLNNPQLLSYGDRDKIVEILNIVKNHLDSIYGKDIYEKVLKLSNIGAKPDFSSKKESLDILLKIDKDAKPLALGKEFSEKLNNLVENQRKLEYEKLNIEQLYGQEIQLGNELNSQQKERLNKILQSSPDIKQRKVAEFMLKINREIKLKKDELSHDNLHHREHVLGIATHHHHHDEMELDDVDVPYHEHTHDGHHHTH